MKKQNGDELHNIISTHDTLSRYCDSFWNHVYETHKNDMQCREGCSCCCILQTVNSLVAYLIVRHIQHLLKDIRPSVSTTGCIFLFSCSCRIYPVRSLLYRTRGLLLKSTDFEGGVAPSCERNFISPSLEIKSDYILDIDTITISAAKVNYAFSMTTGDLSLASLRIDLLDIANGRYPPVFDQLAEVHHA